MPTNIFCQRYKKIMMPIAIIVYKNDGIMNFILLSNIKKYKKKNVI